MNHLETDGEKYADQKHIYNGSYTGEYLNRIAFPIGGLGAGMFCLEGTGAISHVSVRNRPEIFNEPGWFAAISIKGQKHGAKVLEGPVPDWKKFGLRDAGNGLGGATTGLPHFQKAVFKPRFPFATIDLTDNQLPLQVQITGWSPFIPTEEDNSSLPVGALEYKLTNKGTFAADAVFSFNAKNFLKVDNGTNSIFSIPKGFVLHEEGTKEKKLPSSFAIFTDEETTVIDHCWFRGGWSVDLVAQHHARALAGGIQRVIGHVQAQAAPRVDALDAGQPHPVAPGRHHARQIDLDQVEAGQVGRAAQGRVRLQQARAAQRQQPFVRQLLDVQIGMHPRCQADADIDTIGRKVGIADAGRDARIDIGVLGQETIQPRHQPLGSQAGRRAHHQHPLPAALVQLIDGHAQALEGRADAGLNQACSLGQLDGTRAAHEQLQAEQVLQPADLVAERGRRDVQFFRRLGEAQMACGRLEGAQRVERWQGPAHALVSFISEARGIVVCSANSCGIT